MSEDRTPTKIPRGRWGVEAFACLEVVGLNLGHVGGIQSGVSRVWIVVGSTAEAVVSLLIVAGAL